MAFHIRRLGGSPNFNNARGQWLPGTHGHKRGFRRSFSVLEMAQTGPGELGVAGVDMYCHNLGPRD